MRTDGLLLVSLAVVLAWPVPLALAGARWPRLHPRAAIVLWQAIGISGGLAAIGSLLVLGLAPVADHLLPALRTVGTDLAGGHRPASLGRADLAMLALATLLLVRLLGVLLLTAVRVERDLLRQRRAVDLAASHTDHRLRVLEHPAPAVYCLPGARPRVVITEGAIAALSDDELAAVLAHEHAHARGRHELVVQPFVAWQSALPFLPPARRAVAAVTALVEMLADDRAADQTGRAALARALVAIGGTASPGGSAGPKGPAGPTAGSLGEPGTTSPTGMPTLDRVRRLTRPPPTVDRHARMVGAAAWLAALALVAGPTWLVVR
jgi:Zn-dependent protease with chaperone function